MSDLLITGAWDLPMTEARKSFTGHVRIRGAAIAEVSEGAAKPAASEEVIDAGGAVLLRAVWEDLELMPWLIRIYGCARVLRPEHFYAGSLLGCVEAILSRVTTV